MKVIETYKDSYHGYTTTLYEMQNGLRVLHTLNPQTIQFDYNISFNGGAFYEEQIGVPKGTAHFLEHILAGNPNSIFKTKEERESFIFGSRYQPSIAVNASTGYKYLSFYGRTHKLGATRLMKFVHAEISFPLKEVDKYIEKERKIILGELQDEPPLEKNSTIQYNTFFFKDTYPEFSIPVLGLKETIKKISAEDIRKYYKAVCKTQNAIVSIQSDSNLHSKQIKELEKLDQKLSKQNNPIVLKTKTDNINTDFKFKHLQKESIQGVFFSVNTFEKFPKQYDLERNRLEAFTRSFMYKIGFDHLREKLNLIYKLEIFNDFELFDYVSKGYSFTCEKEVLEQLLNESYELYNNSWEELINDPQMEKWFESVVSHYIYHLNSNHDEFYARNKATDMLIGVYNHYDFEKAKKFVLNLDLKDIKNFYRDNFIGKKPSFWFVSSYEDSEILDIFKKSAFYQANKTT